MFASSEQSPGLMALTHPKRAREAVMAIEAAVLPHAKCPAV
jgi:hypothetical protein